MITIHDFTERQIGEPLLHPDGGRVEACPVCGRPAWAQRYPPYRGHYPAHYLHRTFLDENSEQSYERCYVENAPRGDGLTRVAAVEIEEWLTTLEGHCRRAAAALGLGWYRAITDGQDARYYVEQLRAALAAAPDMAMEATDGG